MQCYTSRCKSTTVLILLLVVFVCPMKKNRREEQDEQENKSCTTNVTVAGMISKQTDGSSPWRYVVSVIFCVKSQTI